MTAALSDGVVVDGVGADLRAAGYTTDGVAALLGEQTTAALHRGLWWPALRGTKVAPPPQRRLGVLVRLFLLGSDEPGDQIALALPSVGLDALAANGVIEPTGRGAFRSALDIRPHSDGARDLLVVSDQDPPMRSGPLRSDHVLGIVNSSVSLARMVIRDPVERALDLGTGSGIQALHLAAHCSEIVATDVNRRALELAAGTARLNGMTWDLRYGSLFEPVAGERFDLIVSNPPFVVGDGSLDYLYRDSGVAGDALCQKMIEEIGDHLNPGGTAQIMANWIVRDGHDWRERVHGWLAGTALDAWVVQRELADPMNYVSLWTTDASEMPEHAGQWLDWFAAESIAGVGMGVITLCAPRDGSRAPVRVLEELTSADDALSGAEVAAFFARQDYLRDTDDEELLTARLSTAPVLLDEQSLPGPDGWQSVAATVRRPGGPGAVIGVDEVSKALLAGCRGEVPLGALIELLAAYHDVNAEGLALAALPVVREAIARGILYQAR